MLPGKAKPLMANYRINEGYADQVDVKDVEKLRHVDGFFYFSDGTKTLYVKKDADVKFIRLVEG